MFKDKKLIALAALCGATMFNSFTLGTLKNQIHEARMETERLQMNHYWKTLELNESISNFSKTFAVDKKTVENRVISTLKSDYECPNDHFKDVCLILNNYHGIY